MKTKIVICIAMLAITSSSFAQRGFSRGGFSRGGFSRGGYYGGGRCYGREFHPIRNAFIAAALFPRVCYRPYIASPAVVVVNNPNRSYYSEPVNNNNNVMSNDELYQLNRSLQGMNNEIDRVKYLKDRINYQYVNASQLSALLYNLTIEEDRLDLAKFAYIKTVDPQNYNIIFNTLSYNDTKNDLDTFIKNQNNGTH